LGKGLRQTLPDNVTSLSTGARGLRVLVHRNCCVFLTQGCNVQYLIGWTYELGYFGYWAGGADGRGTVAPGFVPPKGPHDVWSATGRSRGLVKAVKRRRGCRPSRGRSSSHARPRRGIGPDRGDLPARIELHRSSSRAKQHHNSRRSQGPAGRPADRCRLPFRRLAPETADGPHPSMAAGGAGTRRSGPGPCVQTSVPLLLLTGNWALGAGRRQTGHLSRFGEIDRDGPSPRVRPRLVATSQTREGGRTTQGPWFVWGKGSLRRDGCSPPTVRRTGDPRGNSRKFPPTPLLRGGSPGKGLAQGAGAAARHSDGFDPVTNWKGLAWPGFRGLQTGWSAKSALRHLPRP